MTQVESPMAERSIDPAQTALGYFLKASWDRPASVVAQGAVIAKTLKETGEDPIQLKIALLSDESRMKQIMQAAEAAHKNNPRARKPTRKKTVEIVGSVFENASVLTYLTNEQLDHLSGLVYQHYASQRPYIYPEEYMREARDRMLKGKIIELYGQPEEAFVFTIYQS
jgi:hypothetical protein